MAADIAPLLVPLAAQGLGKMFGPKGASVGQLIQDAFNAPAFTDIHSENHFTYKLAPSYGTLNKDSIKQMDEQLKVCIAGTVREFNKVIADEHQQLSWDQVLAVMQQNTLVETFLDEPPVYVSDKYTRDSTDVFKVDGSPSQKTVDNILCWFRKTVKDEDVLKATSIDEKEVEKLARIVAETGAHIYSAEDLITKTEDVQRTLLDVGVIRFPDMDHPYFKVYRLQLHAWRHCKRVLFVEENSNGLQVEFNCRKYQPRKSVLANMRKEVIDKAAREAEALFD